MYERCVLKPVCVLYMCIMCTSAPKDILYLIVAMGPIRSCVDIRTMTAESVRPISGVDFEDALRGVK